ncbi:MAG TPA: hypothetical protein VET85_03420 [Stellaceae bacterium]|nr:hypothetical protein [Stellaceae bacterium]
MARMLTADDFTPHIGKRFSVAGRPESLTLKSVETGRPSPGLQRVSFTLLFQGARSPVLPEGLYDLVAEAGAGFEIYVMPIMTASSDRQDYQAIFN